MPLGVVDRLLTVVVTATITSAAWIVVGNSYLGAPDASPSPAQPTPTTAALAPRAANSTASPAAAEGRLQIPVAGVTFAQLRDTFEETRDGGTRPHEALDIMAPAGTPVVAPAPGTIEKLFRSDAGGNTIYLRSLDKRMIFYLAHLESYAAGLKEGQTVGRGERLGTVGFTGNANPAAPHLHFAMLATTADASWWEPTTAVNPYNRLKDGIEKN